MSDPRTGHFLMSIIDGGGTVPPAMGLGRELVRRGHTVTVQSDPTVAASARAAGCDFIPWRAAPHVDSVAEQTALLHEIESGSPLHAVGGDSGPGPRRSGGRFAADVSAAVADRSPDALLMEGTLPGILIGAIASGLPTAALMPNIYLRPTPGMPVLASGWLPASNPVTRARDAMALAVLRLVMGRFLPDLNAVLAEQGQPPIGDLFELLDRCTQVLVMTSPTFDFASPHIPDNVHYVGPQLDDPDWAGNSDWRPDGDDPLVLVATSSVFQRQTDLLRRVATALGQLPVRGLITAGRAIDPADIPAAANVRVVRAAPHGAVLAETAVVVTHAGHGSVSKALAAGVPLVCMPMGRDQKDNTVRVLRLGAGVRVHKSARPDRIAAAVQRVLQDSSYAEAAQRFAGTLAEEPQSRPSAADRAEALLPAWAG